jgi:hypothetical protein
VKDYDWVEMPEMEHPFLVEGLESGERAVFAEAFNHYFVPRGQLWPLYCLGLMPRHRESDMVQVSVSFKEDEGDRWSERRGCPVSLLPELARLVTDYASKVSKA